MKRTYAIYGCGGVGREVAPVARENLSKDPDFGEIVFVVDADHFTTDRINGMRCVTFDELASGVCGAIRVCVAQADPADRRRAVWKCREARLGFFDIRAPGHLSYDNVQIGEGAIFCEHSMVTSNAVIGDHFQCHYYSYVAHDCVIGDFVTFAPRVCCSGNVRVEDDAYIGAGALLRQGSPGKPLVVGEGAVVGMGAVVTRDVPPHSTVVGNPARVLER